MIPFPPQRLVLFFEIINCTSQHIHNIFNFLQQCSYYFSCIFLKSTGRHPPEDIFHAEDLLLRANFWRSGRRLILSLECTDIMRIVSISSRELEHRILLRFIFLNRCSLELKTIVPCTQARVIAVDGRVE